MGHTIWGKSHLGVSRFVLATWILGGQRSSADEKGAG